MNKPSDCSITRLIHSDSLGLFIKIYHKDNNWTAEITRIKYFTRISVVAGLILMILTVFAEQSLGLFIRIFRGILSAVRLMDSIAICEVLLPVNSGNFDILEIYFFIVSCPMPKNALSCLVLI